MSPLARISHAMMAEGVYCCFFVCSKRSGQLSSHGCPAIFSAFTPRFVSSPQVDAGTNRHSSWTFRSRRYA